MRDPTPLALARRLPHHRRQARIAGQRPLVPEPLHIAQLGQYHHRRIGSDPRHRLQTSRSRIGPRHPFQLPRLRRQLHVQVVHFAQPRIHHQTARRAQFQSLQPRPPALAKHIRHRLLESLLVQHCLQLIFGSGPLSPQRNPQPNQQPQLLRRLIGHPRLGQQIAPRQMRQRL